MARPQSIDEPELIARLSRVFRDVGYEGASLTMLERASGLKKASLYHRFPGGKAQMAEEVLRASKVWMEMNVFTPLKGSGTPTQRLAAVARNLDAFYSGGRQACLLNMLAAPHSGSGAFSAAIKTALKALIGAFEALAREAGCSPAVSAARAERTVMLLHGSLVLSRGLNSRDPFQNFLQSLPGELLGDRKSR
ncbi:MAG: TetR/AcrR family transcriptional regulator [Pseudolabrys sp.]